MVAAVGEQLYDALFVWEARYSIIITDISPIFQQFLPSTKPGDRRLALILPSFGLFDNLPMAFLPSMHSTLPKMEASPSNIAKRQERLPVLCT